MDTRKKYYSEKYRCYLKKAESREQRDGSREMRAAGREPGHHEACTAASSACLQLVYRTSLLSPQPWQSSSPNSLLLLCLSFGCCEAYFPAPLAHPASKQPALCFHLGQLKLLCLIFSPSWLPSLYCFLIWQDWQSMGALSRLPSPPCVKQREHAQNYLRLPMLRR